MLDFDELDMTSAPAVTEPEIVVRETVPVVQETVRITPVASSKGASFLTKPDEAWGWSDLRDFCMGKIEEYHGPQVRDPLKEASIFKSFMSRWPEQSVAIARAALGPVNQGMWCNAPISLNRFCKASDVYFASKIAGRI